MKRVCAYLRVSTASQDTGSQLLAIKQSIERSGDLLVEVYSDEGISGAKGREQRPGLDQMLKDATSSKFEKVICFDITRLGRSLTDLLSTMNALQSTNVDLQLLQNNLDTSSNSGRLMFSIFGAIGEFEKSLIRERIVSGLVKAKANNVKLGRRSSINSSVKTAVLELKAKGMGPKRICSLLKIGCYSYYKIVRDSDALTAEVTC
jgi:DNA invertase Pin-like site-specific DNA recombinase